VQVCGERRSAPLLVGEQEHADASGLAIGPHFEQWPPRRLGSLLKLACDPRHVGRLPPAQEGERDVNACPRDDSPAGAPELGKLPVRETVEHRIRKA
jgi:hypothetical protein